MVTAPGLGDLWGLPAWFVNPGLTASKLRGTNPGFGGQAFAGARSRAAWRGSTPAKGMIAMAAVSTPAS